MSRRLIFTVVLWTACPVFAQDIYPPPATPNRPEYPPLGAAPSAFAYPAANPAPPQPTPPFQYQTAPAANPGNPPAIPSEFRESTWYSRIDYYHWNERLDGADFVNEYGTLLTLGYEHRAGVQRFRGELFGSTVNYAGSAQFDDGGSDPLHSTTKYLGLRGEYDLLIEPEGLPQVSFFAGLGTRFWIRDMKDDISDGGYLVQGYQETWWTIYPYLGVEKRRTRLEGVEFYYAARVGCTPITYERVVDFDTTLYPQIGLTGQLEAGIRGRRFLLSACFEGMGWSQSDVVRDSLQPASSFTTVGLKAGYCF